MIPEFHPAAELELEAAVAAGEELETGLGAELSTEAQRLVRLLCELPRIGNHLGAGYRRFPLTRFPYALIYRTDGKRLQVVAVAHRRQRPNYWRSRL
jgi:plasmid stabilization system protein ParE